MPSFPDEWEIKQRLTTWLQVKLIDFGSAVVADPTRPRPTYDLFYGTTAYAAPEILRREPYLAAPAEAWTLGVLLSFLLTGASPFPSEKDALAGRIRIKPPPPGAEVAPGPHGLGLNALALDLMAKCLVVDPSQRADIQEIRSHPWLRGALRSPLL
jgi:serine/threonine protein kinase